MDFKVKLTMTGKIPSGIETFEYKISESVFDMLLNFLVDVASNREYAGEVIRWPKERNPK